MPLPLRFAVVSKPAKSRMKANTHGAVAWHPPIV